MPQFTFYTADELKTLKSQLSHLTNVWWSSEDNFVMPQSAIFYTAMHNSPVGRLLKERLEEPYLSLFTLSCAQFQFTTDPSQTSYELCATWIYPFLEKVPKWSCMPLLAQKLTPTFCADFTAALRREAVEEQIPVLVLCAQPGFKQYVGDIRKKGFTSTGFNYDPYAADCLIHQSNPTMFLVLRAEDLMPLDYGTAPRLENSRTDYPALLTELTARGYSAGQMTLITHAFDEADYASVCTACKEAQVQPWILGTAAKAVHKKLAAYMQKTRPQSKKGRIYLNQYASAQNCVLGGFNGRLCCFIEQHARAQQVKDLQEQAAGYRKVLSGTAGHIDDEGLENFGWALTVIGPDDEADGWYKVKVNQAVFNYLEETAGGFACFIPQLQPGCEAQSPELPELMLKLLGVKHFLEISTRLMYNGDLIDSHKDLPKLSPAQLQLKQFVWFAVSGYCALLAAADEPTLRKFGREVDRDDVLNLMDCPAVKLGNSWLCDSADAEELTAEYLEHLPIPGWAVLPYALIPDEDEEQEDDEELFEHEFDDVDVDEEEEDSDPSGEEFLQAIFKACERLRAMGYSDEEIVNYPRLKRRGLEAAEL